MILSQLASLLKQDMGRVRRRTSRKQRSIALVVRTFLWCAVGQARKARSASRSRSRQATALGASVRHPSGEGPQPVGAYSRSSGLGLIDQSCTGETLLLLALLKEVGEVSE